ncbi:helix-turn-helix domain-containing protein [Pedobacter sp. KLB.chiD]|uniref:helix-turn-helix domain-containing protein n=1 Tax=Pedobacter sp. KLB.chiD TaxID=3387402 RepID=UPI00399A6010
MEIDKHEFLHYMRRIMERLDILSELISDKSKGANVFEGDELLDNQDLMIMLKISSRSLQRYRTSGKLRYYVISGKIYYKLSDVHEFIRDCLKNRDVSTGDK